jgi:N-glycosylase/DNA lyase
MDSDVATLPLPPWPFDLAATLESGQAFHWTHDQGWWRGALADHAVAMRQTDAALEITPAHHAAAAWSYLGLDDEMSEIIATFPPADGPLAVAMQFCPGLRILRQPAWETLATFITSALKQVVHIRQISLNLRQHFGAPLANGIWAYPSPESLANAGESALRQLGLGFRAKSLHRTATLIASGEADLAQWQHLPDADLAKSLITLPGVGTKIAHCTMLFGFGRLGAFPIDVWVERILRELYFKKKRTVTAKRIAEFGIHHFGPCRGYAQQFLFHHARLTKLGTKR